MHPIDCGAGIRTSLVFIGIRHQQTGYAGGNTNEADWVNPHGFIYIDVKGSDGKVVNWAIETGGPNALLRRGVRKTDFVIGTKITVRGFRAKNGLPLANGRTITLADGRSLFAGSSGTGAPRDNADPTEPQY